MPNILFFDTETTGMINWKIKSEDKSQPHIVQLGAVLVDEESRKIIKTLDKIVKPEGWIIPDEVTKIHGITTEHASKAGSIEPYVISQFLDIWRESYMRVAFNTTYDNRIIRIGTKRFFSTVCQDEWKAGSYKCAMIMASKIMGGKWPNLSDAYKYFTDKTLENAHTAMADTLACMEIYFAIIDRQKNG